MNDRTDRIEISRLAIPSFLVVMTVFSAIRLLGIDPWAMPAYDAFAYWVTRSGIDYSATHQGITGAFLYSPLFAQLIAPLTALPWTVFLAIWTFLLALPLVWLAGRYALPLLVLPPVFMSVALGQLDLAFAGVAILGLRYPVLWALPLLTKITPGIGLLWFLVRGEWRSLGIALGATASVAAVSAVAAPEAWGGWIALLARMDFPELGGGLWFLPLPLGFRLFVAAALIAWGAAGDRRWVIPVGVCLSLPTVWLNSPTILIALLPLVAAGARTPAAAWLRRSVPRVEIEAPQRRLERWFRRVTTS
ncbi:MAG TPA: glycosyltransferase family 87 protein [Candidatus Limnocylindrales bacterium]|nr:glycosyltransferase family 87 protein [Candidatus Limnocylindrales bacterium]